MQNLPPGLSVDDPADQEYAAKHRRALTLDVDLYQAMLGCPTYTEAQKQEFIETLWTLVVAFVDLGFGIHPAQQSCGQVETRDCPINGLVGDSSDTDNNKTEGGAS